MVEITGSGPILGHESVLTRQTATPKSGVRHLEPVENYDPNTYVEKGRTGSLDYFQQKLGEESHSFLWRGYVADGVRSVTGAVIQRDEGKFLMWIPLEKYTLGSAHLLNLISRKYPTAEVVAKFYLSRGGEGTKPLLSVEAASGTQAEETEEVVDYFGRSLNWNQNAANLRVNYANEQKPFTGDLQGFLAK